MGEWAQVLAGPPPPAPLERGHWYRVVDRLTTGTIRVSGANAVGIVVHESQVRIVTEEPTKITRIQGAHFQRIRPGQPTPQLAYYGVCPTGHEIKKLGVGNAEADCAECGKRYGVEDEQHL